MGGDAEREAYKAEDAEHMADDSEKEEIDEATPRPQENKEKMSKKRRRKLEKLTEDEKALYLQLHPSKRRKETQR